ncbi:probable transporter Mch4p [[Candida] anglica]
MESVLESRSNAEPGPRRGSFPSTTVPIIEDMTVQDENDSEIIEDFPDGGIKAYFVLFGSFLGLTVCFGLLNSIGAIQAYLSQNQLKDVDSSTVAWIFSILFCISYSFSIFVGPYFDTHGPTVPLVGGAILTVGGLLAVANSQNVWQFILSLSICVGIGLALCFTPLVAVVSQWFYLKRGRATGLATTGGSVGGIVIPLLLRGLYPKVGFSWAIRTLALLCLVCMIIAILLAKGRTIRGSNPSPGDSSNDGIDLDPEASHEKSTGKKFKQLFFGGDVRYLDFSHFLDMKYTFLTVGIFLEELALMLIVTYFATYAISQGASESDSYLLLTVFNATGIPGRWIPGHFSDIIGHFNVMLLMLTGVCLSVFLIWLPFGNHHSVLWVFAAVCGFFSASILSLTPVCLGSITPHRQFGERFGMMYAIVSIGNLFGFPMAAAIIGNGSKKNYDIFVVFCGILVILGTISIATSRYFIVGLKLNVKV